MTDLRLVFVGSPPLATPILAKLVGSAFRPQLVVTPPDRAKGRSKTPTPSELVLLAQSEGLSVAQPKRVCSEEFLSELRELAPDVILVAAFGEYLSTEFLALPRMECLNVHPSLLPRHRGASPVQAAIRCGDEVSGVSIQRVAKEMDAGDVLLSRETALRGDETSAELLPRMAAMGADLALEALELLATGKAVFTPQDPSRVTLCKKLNKADGVLDWTESATQIDRIARAMNPWPMARTQLPDNRGELLIQRGAVHPDWLAPEAKPGQVLEASKRLCVATGEGVYEILELKPAGKRAMDATSYLRGSRLNEGDCFGALTGDSNPREGA